MRSSPVVFAPSAIGRAGEFPVAARTWAMALKTLPCRRRGMSAGRPTNSVP
jgi:hypothetical protein